MKPLKIPWKVGSFFFYFWNRIQTLQQENHAHWRCRWYFGKWVWVEACFALCKLQHGPTREGPVKNWKSPTCSTLQSSLLAYQRGTSPFWRSESLHYLSRISVCSKNSSNYRCYPVVYRKKRIRQLYLLVHLKQKGAQERWSRCSGCVSKLATVTKIPPGFWLSLEVTPSFVTENICRWLVGAC